MSRGVWLLFVRLTTLLVLAGLALTASGELGDPVHQALSPHASLAERNAMRSQLGLDGSNATRLKTLIRDAAAGSWGRSLQTGEPVSEMLLRAFPVTLRLCVAALALALAIAVPLSIRTTRRRSSRFASSLSRLVQLAAGIPVFIWSVLALAIFSAGPAWLPTPGTGDPMFDAPCMRSLCPALEVRTLVLPALVLAIPFTAVLTTTLQTGLRFVFRQDYIRAARARGIGRQRISYGHALPNALPALVSVASVQCANILAFAVVTETVFQRPGIGWLLFRAIESADHPVIVAVVLWAGATFAVLNCIAEVLQSFLDPRLRDTANRPAG